MSFDETASAYDIMSDPEKRLRVEGAFLKQLSGKGSRVLDLACATGVHAEFLARWGAEVTACDLSADMISEAASRRHHPNVTYLVRDMRTPPEGSFDLVICIGNSLNLLPSRDDARLVLANAALVLAESGKLLLHCINPASPVHKSPSVSSRRGNAGGRDVEVIKCMSPLASGGRLVTVSIVGKDSDGEAEATTRSSILLDLDFAWLKSALAEAGFGRLEFHGGMDGSAFVEDGSPDMVVVASI